MFASPVAEHLLHFGHDLGYRTVLVEPDLHRIEAASRPDHLRLASTVDPSFADGDADVVVTDHDRPELGAILDAALQTPARWIGVMGSPRHTAPHVAALRERGVDEPRGAGAPADRVEHGSRTPAEIAVGRWPDSSPTATTAPAASPSDPPASPPPDGTSSSRHMWRGKGDLLPR